MEELIAGGTGEKKKQVVADAFNRLLYNTVLLCTKAEGVRPYFDIGVWSYGGERGSPTRLWRRFALHHGNCRAAEEDGDAPAPEGRWGGRRL